MHFSTFQPAKVVPTCGVFSILTSICASCRSGMHFVDISTTKSGRKMCILPTGCTFSTVQPKVVNVLRATVARTFRHFNQQKWSQHVVFSAFWFPTSRQSAVHFSHISTSKNGPRPSVFHPFRFVHVVRATTMCTFSTSQLPKVLRK